MRERLIPERYRFLSGSGLKTIAALAMLADHAGFVLFTQNPVRLFTLFRHSISVYMILRLVGRIAFPVYCFLLVEGFLHTGNRIRYAIRLFVFALVSEIPYNLMMKGTVWYPSAQNVFFTLFLGLSGMILFDRWRDRLPLQAAALLGLFLIASFGRLDYGASGFSFIMMLYFLRDYPLPRAIVGAGLLGSRWQAGLAFVPIAFYNGKRGYLKGPVLKYAFYAFYPVHILILYYMKTKLIGI
ncbi:MAG: TraX protein [Clostridia bacterium]|nr:TraX protein [Clostridia bacterium]